MVVANKRTTAEMQEVSPAEAKRWASRHGFTFMEVNAASGEGVEALFSVLVSSMLARAVPQVAADVQRAALQKAQLVCQRDGIHLGPDSDI